MSDTKQLILRASKAPNGRANIEASIGNDVLAADVIDLWSDSDRDRFANAIHEAIPALQIMAIQRELLKIDRENLPAVAGVDDAWPEPVNIERPKVPAFPVGILPEPLRSWVMATAEACQVPADLPGLLGLAVCAGAVARRIEILAGRGWYEPVNLYVAVLLEPANRKSAVFASALKPLRAIERELIEDAAPEHARLASARRIKEKYLAKLEKKAGETGDREASEEAARVAEDLASEPVPSLPRLMVDDATAEAIEIQLAAQGGRLVVAGCEGGLFDVMAGRYSSGVGNLDCFLKGHAGDDLRTERVTRASIVLDRCCLTLAYAVQPDVIRGMAERPSFRGRGLIGRFLYSVPESRLGLRRIDAESVPHVVADAYDALVRRLALVPGSEDGFAKLLTLAPDAYRKLKEWEADIETMLGDRGRMAEMTDWGGKLCGLTARLAAIMHLIQTSNPEPWMVPVSLSVIESAIDLARWSIAHAEAVIAMMTGADGPIDDAAYILRWLEERRRPEFTRRDAHVHGRSRFDDMPTRLDDAIELLVDRGWIRPLAAGGPLRPGRPPSPRYSVHPRLLVNDRSKPIPARVKGVI